MESAAGAEYSQRRLDWLLPQWLEDANAYSQSINEDMLSVVYTFSLNAVIFIAAVVIFSSIRRFNSDVFAPKVNLMLKRTPPKLPNDTMFGWVRHLWSIDDDTIIETSGYDVLFFLRFYRLCFKIIAYAAIYCWFVLLPVDGFGNSIYSKDPDAFDHWSMKNIDGGVLWLHLLGVYIFTGITLYHLEGEFIVYAKYRHAYLRQTRVKTRTVLVQGIPHKMRSPDTLRIYFEALYPGSVLKVHLTQNLRHLERLLAQREQDVSNLERCMYVAHHHKERPTVRVGNMQQEVDAIRHYTQSLDELNLAVAKEQGIARKRAVTKTRLEATLGGGSEANALIISEFLKVTGMDSALHRPLPAAQRSSRNLNNNYSSSNNNNNSSDGSSKGCGTLAASSYQNSSNVKAAAGGESSAEQCDVSAQQREIHLESLSVADADSDEEGSFFFYNGSRRSTAAAAPGLQPFQEYRMSTADWLQRIATAPTLSECWRMIKQGRKGEDHDYYHRPRSGHSYGYSDGRYQSDFDDADHEFGRQHDSDTASGGGGGGGGNDDVDEDSECGDKDALIKPPELRQFFMSKAFVTFKSFAAVTTARQILHMQQAGRLTVTEAPEPSDIIWNNMYTTRKGVLWIKFAFDVLITLLIVVWVAPVTLLSFVFSKDAITSSIGWVRVLCDDSHLFSSMVELLQPLAIVAIMNLLPPVMTAISVFEGSLTLSGTQFRAFHRYFAFQIINVFLVTVIAGSVVDVIANIYDNPETWFSLLGSSLPKMGGFFLNYILVKAFAGMGMEILRIAAVCSALLKMLFTPNVTPRDQRAQGLFGAARNMSNPGWFPFAKIYAQDMLTFTICATYACVAPLILVAGLCYFAIASFIYKHQMLFVYQPYFETGGLWWPILARCFVLALTFAQSLMIGMMLLKQSYQEVYFLVVVIVLTTSYYWYLSSVYEPLARQLPLDMAKAMDHQEVLDSVHDGVVNIGDDDAATAAAERGGAQHSRGSSSRAYGDSSNSFMNEFDESSVNRYAHRSQADLLAASHQYAQPPLRAAEEAPIVNFEAPAPPHTAAFGSKRVLPV